MKVSLSHTQNKNQLHLPQLFEKGFHLTSFSLPPCLKELIQKEKWADVDELFKKMTSSEGDFFRFLKKFHEFDRIEFIISIRDADNEWEEDGIWHDDGSRVFAFSLSLTTVNHIEGGHLGIRKKGEAKGVLIKTPSWGEVILFLTGSYGYEHKIHKVTKGRRVIIAGWCT